MKKILITGGAGYIGGHTIIELVRTGKYEVESLDNFSNSTKLNIALISNACGKKIINHEIDINDSKKLKELFEKSKFDAILHFAGLKSVPESFKKRKLYEQVNFKGTDNLLYFCQKYGVKKFIFSSTCAVYGNAKIPVDETAKIKPLSPYAKTKAKAELQIATITEMTSNFNAISLRYFNPMGADISGYYGENSTSKNESLINEIHKVSKNTEKTFIINGNDYQTLDGTPVRDFIHVSDLAKAHVLALEKLNSIQKEKKQHFFDVYNVGSGIGYTVKEIVNAYSNISGKKIPIKYGEKREGDIEKIYASISKISEDFHWKPKLSIFDMIKSEINWQKNK